MTFVMLFFLLMYAPTLDFNTSQYCSSCTNIMINALACHFASISPSGWGTSSTLVRSCRTPEKGNTDADDVTWLLSFICQAEDFLLKISLSSFTVSSCEMAFSGALVCLAYSKMFSS